MSRTALALLASVALLASAPAWAREGKSHQDSRSERTYVGEVVSVDVSAREFVVRNTEKGEPGEMTFHVSKDSPVFIDGRLEPVAALEKGEPVTVTYETADGASVATHIHRHKHHKS
jgi:hypothetical protein